MPIALFEDWLQATEAPYAGIQRFVEIDGSQPAGVARIRKLLADHFVGEAVIMRMGGLDEAADTIANSLPIGKRTQSGDLGELLATEFVDEKTSFTIPIRKLRWKSDRKMPMHGNDIIATRPKAAGGVTVMKGESKSAATMSRNTITGAAEGLEQHDGRPNPSTLAFITKRLYEEGRDAEGQIYKTLQAEGGLADANVVHWIFALSGKDPSNLLANAPEPKKKAIKRRAVAFVVTDHAALVAAVFKIRHGAKP
ncbi:MAG TPA: hypothetical protein DDW98_14770 [Gammaproteobacteria bacterium]|nr:hypothetical protein [Gammaproteobacteria bacterium]